ncbi:MAG: ABC transporter substrate-binding protein [Casimicrobiaceae bacterium]
MTTRRQVLLTMGVGLIAAPLPAHSQAKPQKVFRVGNLSTGSRPSDGSVPAALKDALRGLGYVEPQNIVYESRFADGKPERLAELAAQLVRLRVDVIVTSGGPASLAAKRATATIPIVMAPAAGDAVVAELIASLARPGGNVTGMTDESAQLSAKRMQLLREVVPKATSIAIIWNENDQGMTVRSRAIHAAARRLQVEVQAIGVREPGDLAAAFAALARRRPDAIFLVSDVFTRSNRQQVIDFAAAHRIPAMYETGLYVRDGGLMAYGPSPEDGFSEAAKYVDQILRGARPADLPAQQPNRYYLTINRRTAEALGLTLPPALLLLVDEVIE